MQKQYYRSVWIAMIVILGVLFLSACKSATGTPTPTPISVEAIYTAAAQTVIAQFTQQAPTITPSPIFTDTPQFTATSALPQPTITLAPPTAVSCSNSIYLSDVTIPDGTQMPVNQAFTKTWRVQNTGTCTWTTSYKLSFSYGEVMGGQSVNLANPVTPGQQAEISVNLTVPNKTGKLTGVWVLLDDKGQHFGALLTVIINVGSLSPTPTGSLTTTPTRTLTPGGGSTSTATQTPAPTNTPTPETPTATT